MAVSASALARLINSCLVAESRFEAVLISLVLLSKASAIACLALVLTSSKLGTLTSRIS